MINKDIKELPDFLDKYGRKIIITNYIKELTNFLDEYGVDYKIVETRVEASTLDKLRCLSGLRTEDKIDICFWEEVDTGDYYESGCNKKGFQFNDGSPYDNGFKFCPYCGKQLKIKKPIFDEPAI